MFWMIYTLNVYIYNEKYQFPISLATYFQKIPCFTLFKPKTSSFITIWCSELYTFVVVKSQWSYWKKTELFYEGLQNIWSHEYCVYTILFKIWKIALRNTNQLHVSPVTLSCAPKTSHGTYEHGNNYHRHLFSLLLKNTLTEEWEFFLLKL